MSVCLLNRVTSISSLYSARLHLPVCSPKGLFCARQHTAVYHTAGRCVLHFHLFCLVFELVNATGCLFKRAKNYLCTCGSLGVYYSNCVHGCVAHALVVSDFSCLSNE